jgi:DNA repair exonuclease SbcCD ATPase subunit
MSEMQPDDVVEEIDTDPIEIEETAEAEDSEVSYDYEQDSDSSTDAGETQKKTVKFDEEQQRIFDDAIGKKTFKLREVERQAEALQKQLEDVQSKLPKQERPQVPEAPDPFAISDEEYRRQLSQRDEAVSKAAAYDAQQQYLQQQQYELAEQARQKQQEALNSKIENYASRATKMGIKSEELQVAGATVSNFGIQEELVSFIIEDDHGPLITKYLSQNLTELDNLRSMSPIQAAIRITNEIKPKAAALKPKVNQAPDPVDTPQGAGISPKPKGPKGATFE